MDPLSEKAGKIRPQVVALVILALSVSMIISAFRSLRREFSGVVVAKTADSGFSTAYWIYLVPSEMMSQFSSSRDLEKLLTAAPRRRVGVSRLVHGEIRDLQTVTKSAFSPFIYVEGERHLDLGLQWLLWGVVGIVASFYAFRLAGPENAQSPDEADLSLEE